MRGCDCRPTTRNNCCLAQLRGYQWSSRWFVWAARSNLSSTRERFVRALYCNIERARQRWVRSIFVVTVGIFVHLDGWCAGGPALDSHKQQGEHGYHDTRCTCVGGYAPDFPARQLLACTRPVQFWRYILWYTLAILNGPISSREKALAERWRQLFDIARKHRIST